MHKIISQDEYKKEINNFLNISIDEVSVFFDSNLLVGGFSLIHILDAEKKEGKSLGLVGVINYKKDDLSLSANTEFEKNKKNGELFEQSASKIKKQLLESSIKISKIDFDNDYKNTTIYFDDGSEISISLNSKTNKPLSYDDHAEGYSVYFGEEVSGNKNFNYFKVIFE